MLPRDFITPDGFGITDKARAYLAPLIRGEIAAAVRDGLPQYVRLKNVAGAEEARDRVHDLTAEGEEAAMSKIVDYYFTPVSPFAYLGHARFVAIARRHGATVAVKPINLGRVFPVSGGLPLGKRAPQRQAYRLVELEALVALPATCRSTCIRRTFRCQATSHRSGSWPRSSTAAMPRSTLAGAFGRARVGRGARHRGRGTRLPRSRPRRDATSTRSTARADARRTSPRATTMLTQEAIDRGVFGAPTYVCGGELFWGQDRLDFLDRALAK